MIAGLKRVMMEGEKTLRLDRCRCRSVDPVADWRRNVQVRAVWAMAVGKKVTARGSA